MPQPYRLFLTPEAQAMFRNIRDVRVQKKIQERIDGLVYEPLQQGKPLQGELLGYRSRRAVGQRYRIIYRVERQQVIVTIVAVGLRKEGSRADIYSLAQKLIRLKII